MSYIPENQEIDQVVNDIQEKLKEFRERAENRIMDPDFTPLHKADLRQAIDKTFELHLFLQELK